MIANEEIEGCEHGFVSLDIINMYHDVTDASLFISGPAGLVKHMKTILAPLNFLKRFVRIGMGGDSQFAPIEKAGFVPAVKCRSGVCGFYRSYIVKGEITLADTEIAVRKRDKELGYYLLFHC